MSNRFIYSPQSSKKENPVLNSPDSFETNNAHITSEEKSLESHSSPNCKVHYFQLWQCTRDNTNNDNVIVVAREKKVVSSLTVEQQLAQQDLYKTELCRSFVETGKCKYGKKCRFAHGVEELRPVLRHPKYKTQICACFYNTGFCPYGLIYYMYIYFNIYN